MKMCSNCQQWTGARLEKLLIPGLLAAWAIWAAFAWMYASGDATHEKAGQFGDSFGPLAILVNIGGFCLVVKTIKRDDRKHRKNIIEQQRIAKQQTKTELFEKRYQIYLDFLLFFMDMLQERFPTSESINDLKLANLKAKFLFPNDHRTHEFLDKAVSNGWKLYAGPEVLKDGLHKHYAEYKEAQFLECHRWFMDKRDELDDLMWIHLNLNESPIRPNLKPAEGDLEVKKV